MNALKVPPTLACYRSWCKKRQETKWDVTEWVINIGATFPYSNLLMKGEKFAEKCVGGTGSNSADRLSFQHYNQADSAAVGISLNMINVGMCWENVFRPTHSIALDLHNYTQDKCADICYTSIVQWVKNKQTWKQALLLWHTFACLFSFLFILI